uniref:Uncharacterized protein n=1 Tax=Molossus molossus TaxID=27622 RepID=A0A7J8E3E1_MOLMO|nr:hypothetical protein HJG59_009082 [Molossus molossus]
MSGAETCQMYLRVQWNGTHVCGCREFRGGDREPAAQSKVACPGQLTKALEEAQSRPPGENTRQPSDCFPPGSSFLGPLSSTRQACCSPWGFSELQSPENRKVMGVPRNLRPNHWQRQKGKKSQTHNKSPSHRNTWPPALKHH